MHPVYKRMAQLRLRQRKGELTHQEEIELSQLLDWNMNRVRQVASLENESFVAGTVNDTEWQLAVCAKIDELVTYRVH